jgi:solute:Na+ symporter, SSS family
MSTPWILAQGDLSGHFTSLDWIIVFGYLLLTTVIGGVLAGKQQNIKDFFLAGRKLPWYAVAGSSIATEISAITFVSVPFIVFQPGGNFTYLQLGLIGGLIARVIVATVLVPAYYKLEIYSPYDYMGNQLGRKVRGMTTALFSLGGMLAQSSRVYLTALILALVLHGPLGQLEQATNIPLLVWAIAIIGIVSIGWTLMGGIATVIWTDVILFFVFVIGGAVALGTIVAQLDAGLVDILRAGWQEGKFELWDFRFSPVMEFTIWTAAIAATWGNIGAYGTDQLMAQRLFCCKNEREAKKAIIASYAGIVITLLVSLVGVGLWYYYQQIPLEGEALALFQERGDRIFPIFILTVIPTGLTGLIIAGIFAAAISSLDSILAALSQTSMSAFYLPMREKVLKARGLLLPHKGDPLSPADEAARTAADAAEDKRTVFISRAFVVFWGIVLSGLAIGMHWAANYFDHLLGLALGMAGFVSGGLMAGFFLGFFAKRLNIDGTGFMFAAPLGVLTVLAVSPFNAHTWAAVTCIVGGIVIVGTWFATQGNHARSWRSLVLLAGVVVVILLVYNASFTGPHPVTGIEARRTIAWPWYAPIGSTMTFLLGWLLARPYRGGAEGERKSA